MQSTSSPWLSVGKEFPETEKIWKNHSSSPCSTQPHGDRSPPYWRDRRICCQRVQHLPSTGVGTTARDFILKNTMQNNIKYAPGNSGLILDVFTLRGQMRGIFHFGMWFSWPFSYGLRWIARAWHWFWSDTLSGANDLWMWPKLHRNSIASTWHRTGSKIDLRLHPTVWIWVIDITMFPSSELSPD